MSSTAFGGSFNLVKSNDSKVKDMFINRLKRATVDIMFPWVQYLPFVPPSTEQDMKNMIDNIIAKRRAEKGTKKKDLLQIFVDTKQRADLVSRIAGSDTTSSTLTFTMLLLLNNQEKLNNLVSEIDTAFPAKYDSITFANTQDLPYLNAIINESMRVMPIVIAGQFTTHMYYNIY
jgi:cytochrome P450